MLLALAAVALVTIGWDIKATRKARKQRAALEQLVAEMTGQAPAAAGR